MPMQYRYHDAPSSVKGLVQALDSIDASNQFDDKLAQTKAEADALNLYRKDSLALEKEKLDAANKHRAAVLAQAAKDKAEKENLLIATYDAMMKGNTPVEEKINTEGKLNEGELAGIEHGRKSLTDILTGLQTERNNLANSDVLPFTGKVSPQGIPLRIGENADTDTSLGIRQVRNAENRSKERDSKLSALDLKIEKAQNELNLYNQQADQMALDIKTSRPIEKIIKKAPTLAQKLTNLDAYITNNRTTLKPLELRGAITARTALQNLLTEQSNKAMEIEDVAKKQAAKRIGDIMVDKKYGTHYSSKDYKGQISDEKYADALAYMNAYGELPSWFFGFGLSDEQELELAKSEQRIKMYKERNGL